MIGEGSTPPPDNDNLVLSDSKTPAEALQAIRRLKRELRRELRAEPRLWECPEHRRMRELTDGAEKCALRQFFSGR